MRSDVHFAALRAAAKVAFSITFVGCGGATSAALATEDHPGASSDAGYDANAGYGANDDPKDADRKEGGLGEKPCDDEKDAGRALACDELIASTFGDGGAWPTRGEPVSPDVKACCSDAIQDTQPNGTIGSPYHWQCCIVLDLASELNSACTPWGPPVPPAMLRPHAEVA